MFIFPFPIARETSSGFKKTSAFLVVSSKRMDEIFAGLSERWMNRLMFEVIDHINVFVA